MSLRKTNLELVISSSFLKGIPSEVLLEALQKGSVNQRKVVPDEVIFCAGQAKLGLYLIAYGIIELFVTTAKGKETVLDFSQPGNTLAEEALFSDRPSRYSARSLTETAVLHFPIELISKWVESYPAFSMHLMSHIAQRIDFLSKDMQTFRTKTATARIVCYVLCCFNKAPRTPDGSYVIELLMPRNKLASRLGMTSSHLSRALRELQDHGMLVRQGYGYLVTDVAALSKFVCPTGCEFDSLEGNSNSHSGMILQNSIGGVQSV